MKKIFFLDLDGTFWDNEYILDSTMQIFDLIHMNGHKVFVNTGRSHTEVTKVLYDLPFDGYVFAAGCEIIIDGKQVSLHTLPKHSAKLMKQLLDTSNCAYALEHKDLSYFNDLGRKLFIDESKYSDKEQVSLYESKHVDEMKEKDYENILKSFFFFHEGYDPMPLLNSLPEDLNYAIFFNESAEITSSSISKGTAIEEVKQYFDNKYETVAIGDSYNDVEMMKCADISVCMGNGEEEVKKMCTYVADTIHNDGLYKIIKELVA